MGRYTESSRTREKKSNSIKALTVAFMVLMVAGLGASTDLDNIETITPSGTNPINITGEVLLGSTNDLNMNGNAITSFFGSTCSAGNAMVHINNDGTLDCVDVTGEVQGDFVSRSGDTMTGTLDMQGNAILSPGNVDGVDISNPGNALGISGSQYVVQESGISHDNIGGVSSGDHHAKTTSASDLTDVSADSVSDAHHIKYTNEEAQDATGTIMTGTGATSVTYDDAGNTITISSTDNTIADDQTLSTTADTSGTNDDITIANGNTITIDDDYAANTDASTKCGSDQVLEGGNTCVTNYEAGDDGDSSSSNEIQGLSSVVGQDSALGSGETIDASSGSFRLPVGTDAY